MRRSVRAALERIAEERAKSAVNKAVRDDTARALRLVESQIMGVTSEDS